MIKGGERSKPSIQWLTLQHGRRSTAQKKSLLVDAELNANTRSFSTELVHFIEGMDGCGLITTDLDQVAAGIKPGFLHGGSPLLFEVSKPILIESGR